MPEGGAEVKLFKKVIYLILTVTVLGFSVYGAYALVTKPAEAKAAQQEVETMLKENQEKADEMKKEQEQKLTEDTEEEVQGDSLFKDPKRLKIVGIGDSVMLASLDALYETFPSGYFDAVFGRTIYEGQEALEKLEAEDKLGEVLLFSLGTNCQIYEEDVEKLIEHSGGRPTFWLSTYGVSNDSNEIVQRVIARHDDAYYIDWETPAMEHISEWISSDALHPNAVGAQAYAEIIKKTITKGMFWYEFTHRTEE